jgi:hypothetical protein
MAPSFLRTANLFTVFASPSLIMRTHAKNPVLLNILGPSLRSDDAKTSVGGLPYIYYIPTTYTGHAHGQ